MSTNYYLRTPDTPDGDEGIHLGQSTADGFTFRAHPDRGVTDYVGWLAQLGGGEIFTEYAAPIARDEMVEIASRPGRKASWERRGQPHSGGRGFYDDEGRRWLAVEFC
jgi:hypothetical protein